MFAALDRRPRTQPWRLSNPLADRHRPRETYRGPGDTPALAVDLEPLERAGDPHLLAAAQLLAGMREQAEARLSTLPSSPDVLNDRAAVLLDRGKPAEALALLEQARSLAPQHAQATWNTAVALRALGRTADARAWFERAARGGDPAWAAEARAEAAALSTPP